MNFFCTVKTKPTPKNQTKTEKRPISIHFICLFISVFYALSSSHSHNFCIAILSQKFLVTFYHHHRAQTTGTHAGTPRGKNVACNGEGTFRGRATSRYAKNAPGNTRHVGKSKPLLSPKFEKIDFVFNIGNEGNVSVELALNLYSRANADRLGLRLLFCVFRLNSSSQFFWSLGSSRSSWSFS